MNYHYLAQYLASTQHKIVVGVIGCGGTGSHVLTNLAMINKALIGLGKQPLHVCAYDDDVVEEHNIGRQIFSPADVGQNKAAILVTRINRYFGFDWESRPLRFGSELGRERVTSINILVSCVDSVASRMEIAGYIVPQARNSSMNNQFTLYYWIDVGNSYHSGQVILGTISPGKAQKGSIKELPVWTKEFEGVKEKKEEPSCSLAESLGRQDLFINKMMATYTTDMLWQLLKNYRIHYRGIYVNLESMKTQPILL
jgi:PRTRC genetic system ThiF family protein